MEISPGTSQKFEAQDIDKRNPGTHEETCLSKTISEGYSKNMSKIKNETEKICPTNENQAASFFSDIHIISFKKRKS
jgi:hypothetical protein